MTAPKRSKPGLMRSLGLFIHNIGRGAATPVSSRAPQSAPPPPHAPHPSAGSSGGPVLRRTTTDQRVEQTPAGPVVVKRTTVDEIQLPPGAGVEFRGDLSRGPNPPGGGAS